MGIWAEHFHPRVLLRWDVLGWIIAAWLTVAGLVLIFDQFLIANICFGLVALFLFAKIVSVALSHKENMASSLLFAFFLCGLVGVGITSTVVGVNRYRDKRSQNKVQVAPTDQLQSKPLGNSPPAKEKLPQPSVPEIKPTPTNHPAKNLPDASSVTLRTYLQQLDDSYLDGTLLAGILWQKNFFDVRLDIGNGPVAIHNLDFLVGLDTSTAGVGQISQFPGITAFPERSVPPAWLEGEDLQGKRVVIPIAQAPGMISIAPVWRVHCSDVFANTVVHLVIASIATNPPGADGSLPHELFAPRRPPQLIRVQGEYETTDGETIKKHPIQISYQFKPQ